MNVRTIQLEEYSTCHLAADALAEQVGEFIWSRYQNEIQVEPPSFKTGNQWRLTPQGYAGHIPVDRETRLYIEPKVQIANLFRMLEYAYRLPFLADGDLVGARSLQEVYERLAKILALRVLDRSRNGLHREYIPRSGRLPYLRGKMALESMLRSTAGIMNIPPTLRTITSLPGRSTA